MAETKRVCSPGAEKWLGLEQKVLNDGHIILVDYMGTDEQNMGIARISHGKILPHTTEADTVRLTNYMLKNAHTSPFEFVDITWKWRLPIFVARQVVRHRTAGINEKSARYAELDAALYIPEIDRVKGQDTKNRQGSAGELDYLVRDQFIEALKAIQRDAKQFYGHFIDELGIARELARVHLPVGVYTDWVWKMDLHNTLHFLKLRLDVHAQYEVRVYAEAMANVIKEAWPITWAAFEEHVLHALKLSRSEVKKLDLLFDRLQLLAQSSGNADAELIKELAAASAQFKR